MLCSLRAHKKREMFRVTHDMDYCKIDFFGQNVVKVLISVEIIRFWKVRKRFGKQCVENYVGMSVFISSLFF